MKYTPRQPPELDRRRRHPSARTLPLVWSETMAYLVGLMATDGCLISDGRHLNFKSQDRQLVETFLKCLGRPLEVNVAHTRMGRPVYLKQFSDVAFYRWLLTVGLTPRKSLVLGALAVPDDLLLQCARGLLDGDGSLVNHWYHGSGKAEGKRYEGFTTRFISASATHIEWLHTAIERVLGVHGTITPPYPPRGCWALNYPIRASALLLPHLYPNEDVPKLERKWSIWRAYAERHGYPATLAGRADSELPEADLRAVPSRDGAGRFRTLSLSEDRAQK